MLAGQLVLGGFLASRGLQVEQVIRGCVGIEGIYDLELTDRDYPTYRAMFIVAAFGADTQLWHDASPVFQGEPGSEAAISVPWILIHSPDDELVNQAQTDAFAAHLAELGNTHVKVLSLERHMPPDQGRLADDICLVVLDAAVERERFRSPLGGSGPSSERSGRDHTAST